MIIQLSWKARDKAEDAAASLNFFLDQTGHSLVVSLTSTSRLTTPVDLLLGFFLRWLDGWRVEDEEEVLADAEVLVVAVLFVEDVIVTEGTSECSVKWNTTNKS